MSEMGRTAVIETVLSQLIEEGRELLASVLESEQTAQVRRMEMGRFLLKARKQLPPRGSRQDGWGAFLESLEISEPTAFRYMRLAEACVGFTEKDKAQIPTYAQLGLDRREGPEPDPDVPPPTDDDAGPDGVDVDVSDLNEAKPDRGGWCTPKPIADAVGRFSVDPFTNPRSHIQADVHCMLERGDDGFGGGAGPGHYLHEGMLIIAQADTRVWLQPDYGYVLEAVRHYGHTRFTALLRLDTSTKWFEELHALSELILIPRRERIEFDPPPGVEPSSNPFPHGLFYRRAEDATDEIRKLCYEWRVVHT